MIAWLIKLTGLDSIFVYLILAGIIAGAFAGFGWYEHHQGYNQAATEYSLKIETMKRVAADALASELERQAHANELAQNSMQKSIIELEHKNENLATIIDENEKASANDPHANDNCLGSDSVQRLNRIN